MQLQCNIHKQGTGTHIVKVDLARIAWSVRRLVQGRGGPNLPWTCDLVQTC